MRQSATTQSAIQTASPRSIVGCLNPTLQTALANLDVQLEEELIRYRRQRALGKADYKPRQPAYRKVAKAIDLIPVSESTDRLPSPTNPFKSVFDSTTASPFAAIAAASETAPATSSQELKELAKQYATHVAAESDLSAVSGGSPDDYLESSEELLRTLSQEEAKVAAEQSFMQSLLTPLGVGSMLLLLLSSAMFGFVIMNPASVSQLFVDRSVDRNPGSNATSNQSPNAPGSGNDAGVPQPNLANQEFPELSLDTLGSIKVESGTPALSAGRSPAAKSSTGTTPNPKPASKIGSTGGTAKAPAVPVSPTLADPASPPPAGDIPSPRKLAPSASDNSANYNPAPARSYSPPPEPVYNPPPARRSAPPRSYAPPAAPPVVRIPPTPIKPFQPTPRSNAASQGDRTPPPPSAPASASPTANSYKVVTPYSSDSTLETARQRVPDAYVKTYSDGAKVQFGAYQDEAAAKAQAEELRKQGIPAEVYKP